ncbi:MAG: type III polyketide synthase [Gammaproteobacteria bacterium]
MLPSSAILSLSTAVPPYREAQPVIAEKMAIISGLDPQETKWLKRLYQSSLVKFRHSVVSAFAESVESWWSFGHLKPLTTAERNAIYKTEAPKLALQAATKALQDWQGDPQSLTHIIYVSCTGVIAPGVQSYLQQQLQLSPAINQIGLNMMGCFGAFKGLDLAKAYAQQNPHHRILLVCCELCTLHLQATKDPEHQVGNALFADGAGACVVGVPKANEPLLYQMLNQASYSLPNSGDRMTWEVADTGFLMGLKADVPHYIEQHLAGFVQQLLPADINMAECDWPVHPGGKQILVAVQKALGLSDVQLADSWQVLAEYGNMSSATFLFMLDALRKRAGKGRAVGLGFGPGLTVEGLVLEKNVS